jgi:hypothetical protein
MDRQRDVRHMRAASSAGDTRDMNNTSQPRHRFVRELAVAAALVAAIFSPGMMLAIAVAGSSPQAGLQPR